MSIFVPFPVPQKTTRGGQLRSVEGELVHPPEQRPSQASENKQGRQSNKLKGY